MAPNAEAVEGVEFTPSGTSQPQIAAATAAATPSPAFWSMVKAQQKGMSVARGEAFCLEEVAAWSLQWFPISKHWKRKEAKNLADSGYSVTEAEISGSFTLLP